jgi:hypothetical protein
MHFTVTRKIITSLTIIFLIGTVAMPLVYGGLHKVKMAMLELSSEFRPPSMPSRRVSELVTSINVISMSCGESCIA